MDARAGWTVAEGGVKAVYVAPFKTPLTFAEAAKAMRQGILVATGEHPSNAALALALAKTALETGRWQSMWNNNWGNVKAGAEYYGMYTCITLNEVLNGRTVWFAPEGELVRKDGPLKYAPLAVPPGHVQTRMRAYANAYDGAQQYVDFVANRRNRAAWQRLLAGDPAGYVHALKVKGYFTADEATYRRGVERIFAEYLSGLETLRDAADDEETQPDLELKV